MARRPTKRDEPSSAGRAQAAVHVDRRDPSIRETGLGLFRAAHTRRVLAQEAPSVFVDGARPAAAAVVSSRAVSTPSAVAVSRPADKRDHKAALAAAPERDDRRSQCKSRPSARSKRGGGSGRGFVPWCK